MTTRILQLNFKLNVAGDQWTDLADSVANAFAEVPGLQWKLWLLNEEEREAGGIYLFDSETALQEFLAGPLAAKVVALPEVSNLTAKRFTVLTKATAITRGPVVAEAAASR
jgi:hypothetical protein